MSQNIKVKWLSRVLIGLFLALPLTAEAVGAKPEPLGREEAALLGVYAGPGIGFAIGERGGSLEMIYPHFRPVKPRSGDEPNTAMPLVRNHYDEYSFAENSPTFTVADTLNFERDKEGRGINIRLGEQNFTRRFTHGEDGKPFRIKPPKSLTQLRAEAEQASMPKHSYEATAELVELKTVIPSLHYDLRYTTADNLFGAPIVQSKGAYLDRSAAQALKKAAAQLKSYGYGLVIWEAYRSWTDFKLATLALDKKYKKMLPSAEQGFSHNTGRSIALSLYSIESGEPVQMICDFDELTPAQYSDYLGGTELQRWERDLLREVLAAQGFTGSESEWWHFDYNAKVKYQLLNINVK